MRILAITIFLALFSITSPAQVSPKPPNPLDQALTANTNAVLEAQKNRNVEFLKRTLADDFLAVGSEARLHDKQDILESAHEGELKDYSTYNLRVVPVDDGAAIVTYDCIVHMPEGDAPGMAPRYQHLSDLWVKQDGQWRLKFQQATPARPID
jgi:hypothetical protein